MKIVSHEKKYTYGMNRPSQMPTHGAFAKYSYVQQKRPHM